MKKINIIQSEITYFLDSLINKINPNITEFSLYDWKIQKGRISSKKLADILQINESYLTAFEDTIQQYYSYKNNVKSQVSVTLRLLLWLENLSDKLNIQLKLELNNLTPEEDKSIKQVRAIELILRSLINEQIGSNDEIINVLGQIFNANVIQKWKDNAEPNNILSGTTFSELSNILLNKNIFLSIEDIFSDSSLEISGNVKESLRYFLEDIRVIRNSIAHNKKLTVIQIEVLNNHFNIIVQLIENSDKSKIEINRYYNDEKFQFKEYLDNLKTDNKEITGYVEDINEKTSSILTITNKLNRKSTITIALVSIVLLTTTIVLYLQKENNKTSIEIANDTKKIDDNVSEVISRFDQLEGAIKNANPISNPQSAKDFILNAYIFKNAGESEKSIEMFSKYLAMTKTIRFDIYNDYYQLLKLSFSQKYAEDRTRAELNSDMIMAVILHNEVYGQDAINKINKLKLSDNLKKFLFLVKSNEIKTNNIGYFIYPFYIDVMQKRIDLGKQFEKVVPFFFDSRGPLNLLRENNWGEIRNQIVMNYSLFSYSEKGWNSTAKQFGNQDYIETLIAGAKTYESNPNGTGMSLKNVRAMIKCGTDKTLNESFRSMP